MTKQDLRNCVRNNTEKIRKLLNTSLTKTGAKKYEAILTRLGRGGKSPHWFQVLATKGTLPNLDGKTIGSVVEMLMVAVCETHILAETNCPSLKINPARGVDLPDLDLGVKSPSTNWCTSEPFFSAYERLIGSEYDAVVLLTNYQQAKKSPPLKLQILSVRYLEASEIADRALCRLAKKFRDNMQDSLGAGFQHRYTQFCKFLAYANQSDWRARQLIKLASKFPDPEAIRNALPLIKDDFRKTNKLAETKGKELIPESDLAALDLIGTVSPIEIGLVDAMSQWVTDVLRDAARDPSSNELARLLSGPLNGKIGMSFALQWRYNFQKVFPEISRGQ
ncbi:MAG: hypothetical protein RLZZ398_865 [Verrucomicrobiota bacterium]|jgi:hypothetical protein